MAVAKKPEPKKAEPTKKPAAKPAAKPAPKKEDPKKAPAKPAAKPAAKAAPAPKKAEPAKKPEVKKTYHVVKRKEDNMWEVKLAKVGDAQGKAIKLFKTKPEAEEYVKKMAENQGASIAVHASKGKSKGRIQ